MKISKKVVVCWFKDSRWDKTVYTVSTMYRFGHIGVDIKHKGECQ